MWYEVLLTVSAYSEAIIITGILMGRFAVGVTAGAKVVISTLMKHVNT